MKGLVTVLGVATLAASMIAIAPGRSVAQDAEGNFKTLCVKCHGESGKGDGKSAATLKSKPANWTDCAKMDKIPDDEIFKAIKSGGESVGKSKEMPKFEDGLEDDEIKGLVTFVRGFCKK